MNFIDWIEAYENDRLATVDRLAFEHELEDNPVLAKELEAYRLTEALLQAAPVSPLSAGHGWKAAAIPAAGLLVVLLLLVGLFFRSFPERQETPTPEKATPQAAVTPPTGDIPDYTEAIPPAPVQEAPPAVIPKPAVEQSIPSKQQVEETGAFERPQGPENLASLAEPTVVETDTLIGDGQVLTLTASEEIVLKPGFQAKAGSTFKARVKKEKAMR